MLKVLEVNNIDLPGAQFNGYDMIESLSNSDLAIKQSVVIKQSKNKKVNNILKSGNLIREYYKIQDVEDKLSIHNIFSITSPALINSKEYKEADIIHFHQFHNTKLSIYSLIKIASEKKVILTLHDPWFITGRCVHFYKCDKWKNGCKNCPALSTLFPFEMDNCNMMWKLKKYVFDHIDIDISVASDWMESLVKKSPILKKQKHVYKIPFGIDINKYAKVSIEKSRKHFNIKDNDIVLFLRAQNEFKGTEYVLEALKMLNTNKNIVILTCDNKGLLDEVKNKYRVIDLGIIKENEVKCAMRACDIFLNTSKGESFAMMAVEAMASGKPVIVFDNTAQPSVTQAPECGYLVKDRDSEDLTKALKYLIENKKERIKRGKLATKICKKCYSLERYNKSLRKMYKEVYNRKHKYIKLPEIKNKEIKELDLLFKKIENNEPLNTKINIDFSDINVQEQIENFNNKRYKGIVKNDKKLTNRLKEFIRRRKYLYKFLRIVLGKEKKNG